MSTERTEFDNINIIGNTFDDDFADSNRAYSAYCKRRAFAIAGEFLSRYMGSDRSRVLDAGCSVGVWYQFFQSQEFQNIFGADISRERLSKAKARGYLTLNSSVQSLPFHDNFLDSVFMLDVLVHILRRKDRQAALKEVQRILKPGGVLVASYAGLPYEKFSEMTDLHGWSKRNTPSSKPVYCNFASWDEMRADLQTAGFVIKEVRGFEFLYPSSVIRSIPLVSSLDSIFGGLMPTYGRSVYVVAIKK